MTAYSRKSENETIDRFRIEYINRLNVYRLENGTDTYLRIESAVLNIDEIASYAMFKNQMANQIPDGVEYVLSTQVFPNGKDSDTENGNSRMISEIRVEMQYRHDGQPVVYPLGSISLASHSSLIGNRLIAQIPKSNGGSGSMDFRMLNLSVKKEKVAPAASSGFVFNKTALKTFRFVESVRPSPSGFICYRGGIESSGLFPVIIKKKLLDAFTARLVGHHPNEMGAQLGGELCRNGDAKYLAITEIAFFDPIGNETRLELPADEYLRTSREIESKGSRVVGWLHSHGFEEGALSVSDVDIRTHHEKYAMPYAVMMVADSAHLMGASESHDCSQCYYRDHCTLTSDRSMRLLKGWSIYGWTPTGALAAIPALVVD